MKKIILPSAFLIIASCGSGGSSDNEPEWSGTTNSSGYPEVKGTYEAIYTDLRIECTDGTEGSDSMTSENVYVSQNINRITIEFDDDDYVGLVVVSESPTEGTVQSSGRFSASGSAILEDITLGSIRGTSNTSGTFNPDGWSADLSVSLNLLDFGETCIATTSYRGNKISNTRVKRDQEKHQKFDAQYSESGLATYILNRMKH